MNELVMIFCIALVIETLTEYLKSVFPVIADKTGVLFAITAALGILLCIAFGADLFASFGLISQIPFLGQSITGILCGGGSNIVYDIVERIRGIMNE